MKVLIMFLRALSLVFLGGVGGGGVLLGIFGGEIMSLLLRLERKQKSFRNLFRIRIFLFLS